VSAALALLLLAAAPEPLVEVTAELPDAIVELRYATDDNFMKKAVYPPAAKCLLLERAVKGLVKAAAALRQRGYRLRLYDCYRPSHVQYELWKAKPVVGYVADPKTGSHHSRGGSVDLTLAALDGGPVEMPSGYDEFGRAAHQAFAGGTKGARAHRDELRAAMEAAGFVRNAMEWWHFDLPGAVRFPLRDDPF
jgi:D-alanyl-D-alanine dipeptidase